MKDGSKLGVQLVFERNDSFSVWVPPSFSVFTGLFDPMSADAEDASDIELDDLLWKQLIYLRRQNAQDEQLEADRYDDTYEQVCTFSY